MSNPIGFKSTVVRAAAPLTTGYVAGTVLENCDKFNNLILDVAFTKGSLTDAQIKIETSVDNTNYRQLLADSVTGGVNSPALLYIKFTGDISGVLTPLTIATKYIKISAIGTGTVTGSSLAINAVLAKI
ncbi:discoidin domain-containing protein [bacterium]|nr:discoidin domain-containing protein [bacterium]